MFAAVDAAGVSAACVVGVFILNAHELHIRTTEGKKEFKDLDQEKYPKLNEWFAIKCLVALLDPIAAVTKVLSGCYYPTLALAFPMLRRIKKALGDPAIFAKQAALVEHQQFQADVLHVVHQAREPILELFKQRFLGMDVDLVWISFLILAFTR
ncbi:unnamed protein product [Phytophthora fragariaefolia]|uniref:Unnamed protein product n=1 Tax=Phytophthora fragariaefolia TaxID=1490495 RepID=A0A9W6YKA2_9STRA|nr:unnamed protein product [Phytophthora fragariaefolia]